MESALTQRPAPGRGKGIAAMKISDFDVLTFDCYGTLIDWESGITAALRTWASARGIETSDAESVLDGELDELVRAYQKWTLGKE